jgi:hypothetical protein
LSQVRRGDLRGVRIMQREQLTCQSAVPPQQLRTMAAMALTSIYIDDNLST